jgi:hypothetical protein
LTRSNESLRNENLANKNEDKRNGVEPDDGFAETESGVGSSVDEHLVGEPVIEERPFEKWPVEERPFVEGWIFVEERPFKAASEGHEILGFSP